MKSNGNHSAKTNHVHYCHSVLYIEHVYVIISVRYFSCENTSDGAKESERGKRNVLPMIPV